MKKSFVTVLLLFVALCSYGQDRSGYLELIKAEDKLKILFDSLYSEEVTGKSMDLFREIDSLFNQVIHIPGAFEYGWEKLDKIGKLKSDDGNLKVFSWIYMVSRNDYRYRAYMLVKKKRGDFEVFRLEPGQEENIKEEDYPQKISDWHGKVYYDLVTKTYKRKTFYTLMGADFNNIQTSIKTIEVIALQRGKPVFRDDQFLTGGTVHDRIILEYSSDLAASVRYNKELDMIVYDHLAPLHPIYTGNYQFYGPDGSYDGFEFRDGIWVQVEDIDARNR